MTEQELLEKITKASNGDWKRENFIKNCVGYVIDNFDEIEPMIKRHWLDEEKKQIISSIGTGKCENAFNGTGKCKDAFNGTGKCKDAFNGTGKCEDAFNGTGKCKDIEDKER